jgi:hypothetical protein
MLWTPLPWIYWAFGISLSSTQLACLNLIISAMLVTWLLFQIKGLKIQTDHLAYLKSETSIVANGEKPDIVMDVVSNHVREDDTEDAYTGNFYNKESAERTSLYRTSISHSEGESEASLDYMIVGPTTTHGQETPTSSYGSFHEQDPLYPEVGGQSNTARIRSQPLAFQRSKRAKRDTHLPPEIIITGPGLSSPQSAQKAYLPSLSSSHSPDALQAHSAAVQHEVSVQKIALSSLQN